MYYLHSAVVAVTSEDFQMNVTFLQVKSISRSIGKVLNEKEYFVQFLTHLVSSIK